MSPVAPGSEILASALRACGVSHVFGIPGSQNTAVFEALGAVPGLRAVLTTHELGAAFMANGYYRASGRLAVVVTIPGPGFTYALTGLAEARLDSAALVHVTGQPARTPGKKFDQQAIDQASIARPLAKEIFAVDRAEDIAAVVAEACATALSGDPGPVLVQVAGVALGQRAEARIAPGPAAPRLPQADPESLSRVVELFDGSRKPLLFVGQGVHGAAAPLLELAEAAGAAVIATGSARGIVPEDNPRCLPFDFLRTPVDGFNRLIEDADLMLALGCKLGHAGTGGYRLVVPRERLVHVNTDAGALDANYPAAVAIQAPAEVVIEALRLACSKRDVADRGWTVEELESWRRRLGTPAPSEHPEPDLLGIEPATPATFFAHMREVMPRDGVLVTDSGLHQVLARRHYTVLAERGLIAPTDFQSMGFGLPAAIGARLAAPQRPVVALIGDGCFAMSGMEIMTAVRERIPLTVVLFNDGYLGQIRLKQLADYGRGRAVTLNDADYALFAEAVGARHMYFEEGGLQGLSAAIAADDVTIVEVRLRDSPGIRRARLTGTSRRHARRLLRSGLVSGLKSLLRGGR